MLQRFIGILLLALPSFGGEYAVLSSGQRMRLDHHEIDASTVRLFTTKDSYCEMPAAAVIGYEQEDYIPPPPPPAPPIAAIPEVRPTPQVADHIADPKALVHDAAVKYGLPPKFVESVARVESAMNPAALSPKGAMGVMQLMPATARALEADPADTAQNIEAGTRLLRELLLKYNNDAVKALAAYNAGEGAVDRYNGLPPFAETQSYVGKVIKQYQKTERQ